MIKIWVVFILVNITLHWFYKNRYGFLGCWRLVSSKTVVSLGHSAWDEWCSFLEMCRSAGKEIVKYEKAVKGAIVKYEAAKGEMEKKQKALDLMEKEEGHL